MAQATTGTPSGDRFRENDHAGEMPTETDAGV
jgi:hypothetical protein